MADERKLQICVLHINASDLGGGAEKIAWSLTDDTTRIGLNSYMAVGTKKSNCDRIFSIENDRYRSRCAKRFISLSSILDAFAGRVPGAGRLKYWLSMAGQPGRICAGYQGKEDFDFPGTEHILKSVPQTIDIVHCHNLHGGYFDLRFLAEMSQNIPVVVTMHDEWMMTGHCGCTIGCDRWKTGCGSCPDLTRYPSVHKDATASNWAYKKDIYNRSRLYVATPSSWLMQKAKQSILSSAIVDSRVIHNGIDLAVFKPADKMDSRETQGIPLDTRVLLFSANGIRNNEYKDFKTLRESIKIVAAKLPDTRILFIALGENAEPEQIGKAMIKFVPYTGDAARVAAYYQAADVYLHAAHSDNFPTTVLEALACGTPVVATAVGGIPEQITDGVTGHLVAHKDPASMAERICELLTDDTKLNNMSVAASEYARTYYDDRNMKNQYIEWYSEILNSRAQVIS